MKIKEIEKLEEEHDADQIINYDATKDELALANMAETEGWQVYLRKLRTMQHGLLQPINSKEVTDTANLALIGATTIGNARALEIVTNMISLVEDIRKAKRAQESQKKALEKTQEESGQGA